MITVERRTYTPAPSDLIQCQDCNEQTYPWPHKTSPTCPTCYRGRVENGRRPAMPQPNPFTRKAVRA